MNRNTKRYTLTKSVMVFYTVGTMVCDGIQKNSLKNSEPRSRLRSPRTKVRSKAVTFFLCECGSEQLRKSLPVVSVQYPLSTAVPVSGALSDHSDRVLEIAGCVSEALQDCMEGQISMSQLVKELIKSIWKGTWALSVNFKQRQKNHMMPVSLFLLVGRGNFEQT